MPSYLQLFTEDFCLLLSPLKTINTFVNNEATLECTTIVSMLACMIS
jgi:hypothetical protein